MVRRARRWPLADGGFTLVELVVSMTVLAVGIGAVVNTFQTSFAVADHGNNRSRAVALATREAESMRSLPYDRVGFSAIQPGFTALFEGAQTVVVADPGIAPSGPEQSLGGKQFSFERHVVWSDAASVAGYAEAYKRIVVIVSWTDRTEHKVRQDAFVYPGGMGAYSGPQGGTSTVTTAPAAAVAPAPPLTLTATVPIGSAGTTTVNLAWVPSAVITPPVDHWVVQYSNNGFLSAQVLTDTQPAGSITYSATGLAPATMYWFRVAAVAAGGAMSSWSLTANATTTALAADECKLGTSTVTPSAVTRLNGGTTLLSANALVTVNASGLCLNLQLRYSNVSGSVATTYLLPSGTVWTATLNGLTTPWDTGTHSIQIVNGAGALLGTLTFTVCVHNAKTCP
jgi:prepilin-type N-terminal cleavage/methylation domain-containing protein